MTQKEYTEKRDKLLNEAQSLLDCGKIEESKTKQNEIITLDNEFDEEMKQRANLKALTKVNTNSSQTKGYMGAMMSMDKTSLAGYSFEPENTEEDITNSIEYRKEFRGFVAFGIPMSEKFRNEVTKSDNSAVIPTTLYERIVTKIENRGEIYGKVFKTTYKGGLRVPTASIKPEATWVDEDAGSTPQKIGDKTAIEFGAYKLVCRVAMSLFVSVAMLDAFENQFVNLVAEAMLKAIEKAIVAGTGVGQPKGILTEDTDKVVSVAKTGKLTYNTLIEVESLLPSGYNSTAEWIMTNKTFNSFLGMTDSNGQPIARVSTGLDGKPQRTLIGRHVNLADDYMSNYADTVEADTTFAAIFNLEDYILNSNQEVIVKKYEDNDTDNKIMKAVGLYDGKAVSTHSLVKLVKKAA